MVLGVRTKSAAAVIGGMLVMFSLAILITLLRGIPIGCGCFTSVEEPLGWGTLGRDLLWLVMTLQVYFFPSALQLEGRLLEVPAGGGGMRQALSAAGGAAADRLADLRRASPGSSWEGRYVGPPGQDPAGAVTLTLQAGGKGPVDGRTGKHPSALGGTQRRPYGCTSRPAGSWWLNPSRREKALTA
ncbi:MAG: hypothetical protein MZV70_55995 [Desulfobacterales bacterium]|nr:hypothetical protein [Desulfobacterales bacterium]